MGFFYTDESRLKGRLFNITGHSYYSRQIFDSVIVLATVYNGNSYLYRRIIAIVLPYSYL
jgi:hypothetical protein